MCVWRQAQVLRAWSRCQWGHQEASFSGMAWSSGAIRMQVLLAWFGPAGPSGRRSFGHGLVQWGHGLPAPTLYSALARGSSLSVLAERAVECASAPSCHASEAGLGDCPRSQSGCGSVSRVQPFVPAVTGAGALTDWLLLGSTDLPA